MSASNTNFLSPNNLFLAGGGEMSRLTAQLDWSDTSLGPIELWPQSLRTTLSIILNSKFPMFLWWGPELICFYNDAYRPSLGQDGKHPNILGMPAKDAWPEIWTTIEPLIQQVLIKGQATWSEDQLIPIYRNGKMEDVYWTFSYSPVNDETGNVAGVLVTCTETTEKVYTRKKLEENERRLQLTIYQAPVAISILRGPEYIVEIVNARALELWGRKEEKVLHQPIFQTMPELLSQGIKELLDGVYHTGIPFSATELPVQLNRNGQLETVYVSVAYEPIFDADGTITGIMTVGTEMTGNVNSRKKVEESEEKLRIAIDATHLGTFEINLLTDEMEYSDRYLEIYGFAPGVKPSRQEVINTLHPEDQVKRKYSFEEALRTGLLEYEARILLPGNTTRWIRVKGKILYDINKKAVRTLGTVLDITKEKNSLRLIEENEVRLRLATEGTKLATWDLDLQNRNILYSPRLLEIFGHDSSTNLSHEQMRGQIHQSDLQNVVEKAFDRAMQTGIYDYEARVIRPDNTISWIKTQGKVIFDEKNIPLRMIGTLADITETKNNEEKLAKLAAIVQSSEDAIISKRLDGIVTSWNDAAERIFGYTADEMIGFSIHKIIPEDRIEEERQIIEKLKRGERVKHFDTKRLKKNKSLIDISLSISPIYDSNGNIIGASKVARDITAQKKTERLISENEHRLNIAAEAAELGTWELDLVTDDVVYSKRYLEILELDYSKPPSHKEIMDCIHPDDMLIRDKAIKEAFKTGLLDVEMRLLTGHPKKLKWIKSRGKVFYDDASKPLKMMGTTMDITDDKMNSEELKTSEEKFRLLANTMPQLIWTSDTDGNLNYFNESVYNYSGISKEQLDKEGWLQMVHPDDREENIKKWMYAVTSGEDFLFEHRFRRHDGEYRWQLSRAVPQKDSAGKIQMWVGSSTDIHEIKENEKQKDFFISMASHELKTPITSIKGYVQILLNMYKESSDDFLKGSLKTVNKQIGTLTNLIADLLDMSKIKSGSLQLTKETFLLNSTIKEIIVDMEHTEPRHTFVYTEEDECFVYADKERLGQVLINFLTNAVKYSPNSTIINIKSWVKDNEAVVSIADKGIGINKDDQKKIFQRFYRVEGKDEKTFPGFGIGLFIASEIIERHSGRIEVESEPGKGSIFSFFLPMENTK